MEKNFPFEYNVFYAEIYIFKSVILWDLVSNFFYFICKVDLNPIL